MARKIDRAKSGRPSGKLPPRSPRLHPSTGPASRARVKTAGTRPPPDKKAAGGRLARWTPAEVEEAFRRFQAAKPEPKGELEHINPFTLLVAVVLSAQATDARVNKA